MFIGPIVDLIDFFRGEPLRLRSRLKDSQQDSCRFLRHEDCRHGFLIGLACDDQAVVLQPVCLGKDRIGLLELVTRIADGSREGESRSNVRNEACGWA